MENRFLRARNKGLSRGGIHRVPLPSLKSRPTRWILPLLVSFFIFSPITAEENAVDPIQDFPQRVRKITLENGMRFLLVERPNTPTVSFATFIRTGGLDDDYGMSGIAHMFEHMLFKGTETIGTKDMFREAKLLKEIDEAALKVQTEEEKGVKADFEKLKQHKEELKNLQSEHEKYLVQEEFWRIYEQAGAQGLNASTGYDYTNYVISLPANQIRLWMMMEADRLKHPVLREFYKERDVVQEERRQRIDNSPNGRLWEGFLAGAFVAHPYGRPIVGWKEDLARITRADADAFFKKHYDVSRLVSAIVGGIDADEVEKMIRIHFGNIKSNPPEDLPPTPVEPLQRGERRIEVEYDAEPSLLVGWHRPDFMHPDAPALDVVSDLLDFGRTSRFYKSIIEKKRVATSVWAGSSAPGERDPNIFVVGGQPRSPHTTEDLEKAIYQEIDRLKKEGPTQKELDKVKNNLEAYLIRSLSSNSGLARQLAYYEAIAGDWEFLLELVRGIRHVTDVDVQHVMDKYFKKSNRTVAVLVKPET